jgi:hypothetical protein
MALPFFWTVRRRLKRRTPCRNRHGVCLHERRTLNVVLEAVAHGHVDGDLALAGLDRRGR